MRFKKPPFTLQEQGDLLVSNDTLAKMSVNRPLTQSAERAMASLEQIQQELKTLSPEALSLVHQFIQLLKKALSISEQQETPSSQASD